MNDIRQPQLPNSGNLSQESGSGKEQLEAKMANIAENFVDFIGTDLDEESRSHINRVIDKTRFTFYDRGEATDFANSARFYNEAEKSEDYLGPYELSVTEEVLESRTDRILESLKALEIEVSPDLARDLGLIWIVGHEMGHAVQASYERPYPNTRNFVQSTVDLSSDFADLTDHDRAVIESERFSEGLSYLFLAEELKNRGFGDKQIEEISSILTKEKVNKVEELTPLLQLAREQNITLAEVIENTTGQPDALAVHNFGYAHPYNEEEIRQRLVVLNNNNVTQK